VHFAPDCLLFLRQLLSSSPGGANFECRPGRFLESALPLAGKLAMFLAMSVTVNVAEFKDRFSELLALVERGGEVIVCRRNVPLARVEPIRKHSPGKARGSVVGCLKGTVRIHGDLTEPCIPEADWEMLK
jgi:prevent-host-death family protein